MKNVRWAYVDRLDMARSGAGRSIVKAVINVPISLNRAIRWLLEDLLVFQELLRSLELVDKPTR